MENTQTPSVGRIVQVRTPDNAFKPAIITHVHGTQVVSVVRFDGEVIADGDAVRAMPRITFGENVGEWRWPPRV